MNELNNHLNESSELAGYVLISSYRIRVLRSISPWNTPSRIADKASIRVNHVSNVLRSLKEKNLVVCINESAKKGRVYKLTEVGEEVLMLVNEMYDET